MRQQIIDAILAGRSLRDIAASVTPSPGLMALQRYRAKVVAPAMANAATLTKVLHGQGINPAATLSAPDVTAVTRTALKAAPILAVRENRLSRLEDRSKRLDMVLEERAADMAFVPGGKSGLLVRRLKSIGSGEHSQVVEEYELDKTLLAECREHEKQAAMELGQWQESHSGPAVAIQIVIRGSGEAEEAPAIDID